MAEIILGLQWLLNRILLGRTIVMMAHMDYNWDFMRTQDIANKFANKFIAAIDRDQKNTLMEA